MVLRKAPSSPVFKRVVDDTMQACRSKLVVFSNFSVFFFHESGFAKVLSA